MIPHKKALIVILAMVFISPIFGVILADMVGFHEPLDVAAEALGLSDLSESINWTPFFDYNVPGLPAEMGYIISGLIGIGLLLAIGLIIKRLMKK